MIVEGLLMGAAFVAGVAIATGIVANKMSENEVRKQKKMQDRYDEFCSEREDQYRETVASYQRSYEASETELRRNYEEERRRRIEELKERNRPYIDGIKADLEEQRRLKRKDVEDLEKILNQWNKNKDIAQSTTLRMKSLKRAILTIEEACYKLHSYFTYLERYEHNMEYQFERSGNIPAPFSMILPEYFPYPGKIYYLKRSDFYKDEKNDSYAYDITDEKNLTLRLSRFEKELFELSDREELPFSVMCFKEDKAINKEKLSTYVSIGKAMVKESSGGRQGIYAEVKDIKGAWIQLEFQGQRLGLNINDLFGFKKAPKGSYLTVFVTDYDFALANVPKVSEKMEDGLSLASFDNIIMIISPEERDALLEKLREKKWDELDDEWRIGPSDDTLPPRSLKFQMGDLYGYLVDVFDVENAKDRKYLKFNRLLNNDEFFSYSDIYAAADVTVETISKINETFPALSEECGVLYSYLCSEFAMQSKMLNRSEMTLYLEKWLELTNRLIEVLKYNERVTVQIEEWDINNKVTYLYIKPDAKLKKFLRDCRRGAKEPRFLLSDTAKEKETYLRCYLEDSELRDQMLITVKDLPVEHIYDMECSVDLIALGYVGAELKQSAAFSEFREGRVCNSAIKEFIILDNNDFAFHDTQARIENLYNQNILKNDRQFEAINKAFSVEDVFMIQGPPGTGKTTVIRELIMQQLHFRSDSRILIVSQANVAVDNVLRGIKVFCQTEKIVSKNQMIRCGNDEKIADDIREFSYDGKLDNYINELNTTSCKDQVLRDKWIEFAKENRDIVGECLLKGYQIIGATCVGFANRNIGLSGLEFDLVIIDEAGKALPGELLITINHAKKLILIGDHKQLPPVINPQMYKNGKVRTEDVIDDYEREDFFNKSFFERLWEKCPDSNKCMLDTQFRMPTTISKLVNIFYDGKLKDGEGCCEKRPIAFDNNLVMLDMKNIPDYKEIVEENAGPHNTKELDVVALVIGRLREVYSDGIVVITPYKRQKRDLIYKIKEKGFTQVRVDTIDAFQGDEENIVIYCMTRAKRPTNYFSDSARLNVAFSRAKHLLIIIGSSDYLESYGKEHILYKVNDCIKKNGLVVPYEEFEANYIQLSCDNDRRSGSNAARSAVVFSAVQRDRLFTDLNKPEKETRLCAACREPLKDNEEIICADCLLKSTQVKCKQCGNYFDFPNGEKFIRKTPTPELCEDCMPVKASCSLCGKELTFRASRLKILEENKTPIICAQCENTIEVKCASCGNSFRENKEKVAELKRGNKSIYCHDCLTKQTVFCKHCNSSFEIPVYLYNGSERKEFYCNDCRILVSAVCDSCKRTFTLPKYKYDNNIAKGLYCLDCWTYVSTTCSYCGGKCDLFKWKYNKLIGEGKTCLCDKCRKILFNR